MPTIRVIWRAITSAYTTALRPRHAVALLFFSAHQIAACGSPGDLASSSAASSGNQSDGCSGCILETGECNHGGQFDDVACGSHGERCVACPSTCNAGACEVLHCDSDLNCPDGFDCQDGECVRAVASPCASGEICSSVDAEGNQKHGVCTPAGECCTACMQPNGLCKPFAVPTCGDHGGACVICEADQVCKEGVCAQ